MTKAEERKALDRIKKIVAEAGEGSYIATALDGALELADRNIEEDAAYSCRWYMDKYYMANEEARKEKGRTDMAIAEAEANAEKAEAKAEKAAKEAKEWKDAAEAMKEKWRAAEEATIKNWNAFREQEDKVEALEQEVMKLKAMLFDYMVAERK